MKNLIRRLFLTAAAAVLAVSCAKQEEPAPAPPVTATPSADGEDLPEVDIFSPTGNEPEVVEIAPPPPPPAPEAEPDWKAKGNALMQSLMPGFKGPKPGDRLKIETAGGATRDVEVISATDTSIEVKIPQGSKTYANVDLSKETRTRLFPKEWAYTQAKAQIDREMAEWNTKREQAAAARTASPSAVAVTRGRPVNQRDGSVRQVIEYLHATLRNPGQLRFTAWGRVTPHQTGYVVTAVYETTAGNLGKVTESKYFFMTADGQVTRTAPFKGTR